MMQLAWQVAEGSKVRLKDYDPDFVDTYTDRALAAAELEKLSEELGELQQLLAAGAASQPAHRTAGDGYKRQRWHDSPGHGASQSAWMRGAFV